MEKGYGQVEWIDYKETYAPVARLKAIILLLAFTCSLYIKLYHTDVKLVFLDRYINKEVYVSQSPGFEDHKNLDYVFKLKRSLYGLKQAPQAWY